MFLGKARSLPTCLTPEGCFTEVGSVLTPRLGWKGRDIHSSLLQTLINWVKAWQDSLVSIVLAQTQTTAYKDPTAVTNNILHVRMISKLKTMPPLSNICG